jgi:predicted dinucleotide-binding enzyme
VQEIMIEDCPTRFCSRWPSRQLLDWLLVPVEIEHARGNDGRHGGVLVDVTTIGLIGSGRIGSTVARLAVSAGHHVLLSNSRGPDTLQSLAAELGPRARAATGQQAVAAGDILLVSVPLKAYPHLSDLPLAGKVVMDTGNYYPQRDGKIPELDDKSLTDSEYLLVYLPGSQVVKVFNNIFFKHLLNLARPSDAANRSALPIAGNSPAAKAPVTELLDSIGYGTVDAGSLADGWRQQPGTPVYGAPYGSFDNEQGTPASADVIRAAVAAATR